MAVSLVVKAGLVDTLSGPGPFTVIAPTNDAFGRLSPETIAFLTSDAGKPTLIAILTYHVASGTVKSTDLKDRQRIPTVQGESLDVYVPSGVGTAYFNFAKVTVADQLATNGVAHLIDHVVLPHSIFKSMASAAIQSSSAMSFAHRLAGKAQVQQARMVGVSLPMSFGGSVADFVVANSDKFSSLSMFVCNLISRGEWI
jgi:hypothetical protein